MTQTCSLCGLETPAKPITGNDVEGQFCCRGCLEVSRRLDVPSESTTVEPPRGGQAVDGSKLSEAPETEFFSVDGMHCAVCESFLESRARNQSGVTDADASYAAELVRVGYDPAETDPETVASALSGAGYRAQPAESAVTERQDTTGRLLVGLIFGVMAMMWYTLFLYPTYLGVQPDTLLLDVSGSAGTYILGTVAVLATVVLGYTGRPLLEGAWVSLQAGRPNMDLLLALASGTAYAYSVIALLIGHTEVYFDVTIVIVVVVTLGRAYEERIRREAVGALSDLAAARADTARIRTEGGTDTVSTDQLDRNEEVIVRAGDRIPVDGTVIEGEAAVDESLVTGESTPVRCTPGDSVKGGSIATDGRLIIEPAPGGQSTADRLLHTLWRVQSRRSGADRLADRIASVFVPVVVGIGVIVGIVHLTVLGTSPTNALLTTLAVLVVSCPCALGLATPLAVASGIRSALSQGIVLSDRAAVEQIADTDIIAIDKTGTLTTGAMTVDRVIGAEGVLDRAATLEQYADHPIAEAIVKSGEPDTETLSEFSRHPGLGVSGTINGRHITVGRKELLTDADIAISDRLDAAYQRALAAGKAPTFVAWDGRAQGVIVASGALREGWREVVHELATDTQQVVIITGDNRAAAAPLASHPAVDEIFADVPPEGKSAVIDRLRQTGTVAMVGDGTNDAPALAAADVGIALGSGTDLAGDAADAVVTSDELAKVPAVFSLTAATRRRIRENLLWAFGYNVTAIPLAAIGVINPLFAAIAMACSSILVVANSARSLSISDDGHSESEFSRRDGTSPAVAEGADPT